MTRLPHLLKFAWRAHRLQFAFILLVATVLLWIIYATHDTPAGLGWYRNWLAPLVAPLTLATTVFLWFNGLAERWRQQLPNRLDVIFMYEDTPLMRCDNAYLTGAVDIRAWSQQIGRQMTAGGDLKMVPWIDQTTPRIGYDADGQAYEHYAVTFYLTSTPNLQYVKDDEQRDRVQATFDAGEMIYWRIADPKTAEEPILKITKPRTVRRPNKNAVPPGGAHGVG